MFSRPRADRLPGRLPGLGACSCAGCAARPGLGSPAAAAGFSLPACCGRGVLRGDQRAALRTLAWLPSPVPPALAIRLNSRGGTSGGGGAAARAAVCTAADRSL